MDNIHWKMNNNNKNNKNWNSFFFFEIVLIILYKNFSNILGDEYKIMSHD